MPCYCLNPDGSRAELCNGICVPIKTKQVDAVREREDASLADAIEYRLSCFLNQVDLRIARMEKICSDKFIEGVRFGLQLRDEIY